MPRVIPLVWLVGALVAAPAVASDVRLIEAAQRASGVERATAAARAGASARIQVAYDRARDMREAIRAAGPVSAACRTYAARVTEFADASVSVPDWLDRLDGRRARAARIAATAARAKMRATRASCVPAAGRPEPPALVEPRPGAAFFSETVATTPPGTTAAQLWVNGRAAGPMLLRGDGTAWARLRATPGRYDLDVRFTANGVATGSARSGGVWLLPETAATNGAEPVLDAALQRSLRVAAGRFNGIAGVWVHDLTSGRAASWNAGAKFPAASTVKLGVMVEALRRTGTRPEESARAFDVAAIGGWSSNLAVNRLLPRSGGALGAQDALRRMGAVSSTFNGPYLVATARPPVRAVRQPSLNTRRVTTAADMGALMLTLHRAGHGDAAALAATRMTTAQARLALGTLLNSDPRGDNAGVVRQAFGAKVPIAQKNGWISSAQHTAAIVYSRRGPMVIVVLTSGRGMTRARAATLGTSVVRAVSAALSR